MSRIPPLALGLRIDIGISYKYSLILSITYKKCMHSDSQLKMSITVVILILEYTKCVIYLYVCVSK